jgi:hypothetical protein
LIGWIMGWGALATPLVLLIVYYWSRMFPDQEMTFMFGIRFQSKYLPWAMCAMNVLMGGMPIPQLAGIVAGHVIYFLDQVLPRTHDVRVLKTPAWLYSVVPPHLNRNVPGVQRNFHAAATAGGAAPPAAPQPAAGHNWGQGVRLGRQ